MLGKVANGSQVAQDESPICPRCHTSAPAGTLYCPACTIRVRVFQGAAAAQFRARLLAQERKLIYDRAHAAYKRQLRVDHDGHY